MSGSTLKYLGLCERLSLRPNWLLHFQILFRHIEKQEVKAECPACRGICGCKLCLKQKIRPNTNKVWHGADFIFIQFLNQDIN